MKIQVGTAEQYQDIGAGETYLAVPYSFVADDGALIEERSQSFPLTATQEEIVAFLNQALTVYQDNLARHQEAAKQQVALDNASTVAAAISGLTIE